MTEGPDRTPLARLFAVAYTRLVDDLHEQLRARGWTDVRRNFGFVLLAARDGTTVVAVAELMSATKQAASKLVGTMIDAGYLDHLEPVGDRRVRPVVLTERGRTLLGVVEEIYAELEQDWSGVIGERAVARLRRDIGAVLSTQHGGSLPPVRSPA